MKKIGLTFSLLVAMLNFVTAQSPEERGSSYTNFTAGAGSTKGSFSLSYLHDWRLGKKQKFGLGVGARLTSFVGVNLYYITAPAELTSGSTGPGVIFKENIDENIDSLLVKSPQINALNIMLNIDYKVSSKILVGFNIDAMGFSFGGSRSANYINGSTGKITEASPTSFNVLLICDNDNGSLNSELYLQYFFKDLWALKIAGQFLFTEYTTETNVQTFPEDNDRFRNKALLFAVGITRKL